MSNTLRVIRAADHTQRQHTDVKIFWNYTICVPWSVTICSKYYVVVGLQVYYDHLQANNAKPSYTRCAYVSYHQRMQMYTKTTKRWTNRLKLHHGMPWSFTITINFSWPFYDQLSTIVTILHIFFWLSQSLTDKRAPHINHCLCYWPNKLTTVTHVDKDHLQSVESNRRYLSTIVLFATRNKHLTT